MKGVGKYLPKFLLSNFPFKKKKITTLIRGGEGGPGNFFSTNRQIPPNGDNFSFIFTYINNTFEGVGDAAGGEKCTSACLILC